MKYDSIDFRKVATNQFLALNDSNPLTLPAHKDLMKYQNPKNKLNCNLQK